ncbi:hypothetical protein DOTSEDRAFT_48471 [Lecanosticta acicola]|uniref:EGF-like domain-containing protein n=1 Tax=Lecanosticta acicola TaxID=111012 RepID=A0AAI8W182_9PEZI|nr:hypothetical protein DOTSEDRAFT_48471 [Lecanosticta acicola]
MSRPYYGDDSYIPDYYADHHSDYPRQRPSVHTPSRIPRPGHTHPDRNRAQPPPHMRPDQYAPPPPAWSPRRGQDQHYYPEHSAWETSQHLYDGSGYEDEYDQYGQYGQYEQHDQWPLPPQPPSHSPSARQNQSPRRPPPRPQRPDEVPRREQFPEYQQANRPPRGAPPGNRQPYPPQPQPQSHHGTGQWTRDGYTFTPPHYPPPRRPLPPPGGRDSPSSSSSRPSIPQYVEPQMPQQAAYGHANRRPPLGPPPSARRAPVQYAQVGPVHPIVEETDSMRSSMRNASIHTGGHDSKTSFASSNAIPIGIPQAYLDHHADRPSTREHLPASSEVDEDEMEVEEQDEDEDAEAATGRRLERFVETSPSRDWPDPDVLVRQASVGKKSRPTLTTVKRTVSEDQGISSLPSQQQTAQAARDSQPTPAETERSRTAAQEKLEGQAHPGAQTSEEGVRDAHIPAVTGDAGSRVGVIRGGAGSRTPEEVLQSGTGLLDASSSSESERDVRRKRSKELLGAAIANELHPHRSSARSPLAPRDDEKVKSLLDSLEKSGTITATEAEELKQPMGGLSERAGRRRPPRLNVDMVRDAEARGSLTSLPDLIKRATKLASNLDRGKTASRLGTHWFDGTGDEKRRSGNINDMLSEFPPPGTPNGTRRDGRYSLTHWSSRLRHSALPSDSDAGEVRKRKRRCCGIPMWLFLLLLLVLILLAAAAVVVPVMLLVVVPDSNKGSANQVSSCQMRSKCENDGANVIGSDGKCECLCVNGYTGSTCSEHSEQGCASAAMGPTNNASVGEAIPRLLRGADSNFSIPLDEQELLGLFSSSELTCNQQNALVTFNSQSSKRALIEVRIPTPTLDERADGTASPLVTSSGIVEASGTPTLSATSSAPTATVSVTDRTRTALDFARVVVLYILQDSGRLNDAATAQENLQTYFTSGLTDSGQSINAQNLSLGNGFSCDVTGFTISTSNGTIVGGGSRSTNSTTS